MGKYLIPSGSHRSIGPRWPLTFNTKWEATCSFSKSCLVRGDGSDDEDINKLFGVSDGFSHQQSSIRIGWRSEGDFISLWGYKRYKGELSYKFICLVPVEKEFTAKLSIGKDYQITITTHREFTLTMDRESNWWGPRYKLFPYFGGNKVAQTLMEIQWGLK